MLQKKNQILGTPESEIKIDNVLIRKLLSDQHCDLAHLPIRLFDSGWDNYIFRLGKDYCVRIPRRKVAADLIIKEQKWLPKIGETVTLQVPVPLRNGQPTDYFPWNWSVIPWIEGKSADKEFLVSSQAVAMGSFLKSLHVGAPSDFPRNPYRGISLSEKAQKTRERIGHLTSHLEGRAKILLNKFERAISATNDSTPKILHGDLHPQNVIANHGIIVGIIDWGDIGAGDIATDLATAWMLFCKKELRNELFCSYGELNLDTILRAEGWAIFFGTMLLESGLVNNFRQACLGKRILENILN